MFTCFTSASSLAQSGAGVCAEVKLSITQQAVIAGQAFAPNIAINNGSGSDMQQVSVLLNITDINNHPATNLFVITPPTLSGLTAVDGTGVVTAWTSGQATWTIRPTRQAAPTNTTQYFVSGTLSYNQNGTIIAIPLYPTSIQVMPEPLLTVKYFEERTVYGQDPFSTNIEPPVPFNLGVLVTNSGYGTAKGFTISSGQPQIIDNEKGLLINFKIVGSQAGSNVLSPSLTLNLGDITNGQTAFGRWLMTASLQGVFTNFTASYQAVDDLGNTNLSVVAGVEAHAMIHAVRVDQPTDDGLPDFLVNDIPNPAGLPETVYCSDGPILPVTSLTNAIVTGTICPTNLQVQLTAPMPSGWAYLQIPDPGQGNYSLIQVVRSDGHVVRLNDNAWTTAQTLHPSDQPSYAENLLRIFDYNSTGVYTVTYGPLAPPSELPPAAVTLAASNIGFTNATLNGSVNPNGLNTTVYFEYGPDTNYGSYTIANQIASGNGLVGVTNSITNLTAAGVYHFQLVSVNALGTSVGGDLIFTSLGVQPTITCPTDITTNYTIAQCGQFVAFTPLASGFPTPVVTCSLNGAIIQSPFLFPVGTNLVSCTASNVAGSQSCGFKVTVVNTNPPVAGPFSIGPKEGIPESVPVAKMLMVERSPSGGPLSIASVASPTINNGLVTFGGGLLTYTPAANYVGADTINYVLSDGCGTAAGTVAVTVSSTNAPSQNGLTIQMSGGSAILQFHGVPGQAYYIQQSSSINGPWQDLPGTPVMADALGLIAYTVTLPSSPSFYRTSINP